MLRLILAILLAWLAGPAAAAAAPLEAYGALPSMSDVEIAPDGSRLAMIVSSGAMRGVVVRRLSDGTQHTYGVGEVKVRSLDWVGPDHLIITVSHTGTVAGVISSRGEYFLAYDLDVNTGKIRSLLSNTPGRSTTGSNLRDKNSGRPAAAMNILAGPPLVRTVGGAPTLFLPGYSFPSDRSVLTIFQVDLKSGSPHYVEVGDRYTSDILLGQDGTPIARTAYDDSSGRWTLRLKDGAAWRESRTVQAKIGRPYMLGLGRDGRSILVAEEGDDGFRLREVAPDGAWGEPLEVDDAEGPIFDPETHRLIGLYALAGDEDRYTFFDPADQKAWASVKATFRGERVLLRSWSQDRRKIVVLADSPVEGPAYAIIDLDARSATWLGPRFGGLQPEDIATVQPVSFKAADGLPLTGYLTLPKAREPRNLPLIVFPHGGPASRDTPGFDWWAQGMSSRGYAVLQVNFRGSDGLGPKLLEAGYGEWGRKMQTDLSDGVRHLAGQGIVDAKRVCIVGASYGGYAALAGATLDRGVYRCAVSVAGVSDLRRQVAYSRSRGGRSSERYWLRFLGAESRGEEVLDVYSPAIQAAKADIPILLIHGRDDTVVPLEQSRVMAEALRKAGKPHELVVQKGADHWLSSSDTRLETLTATLAFVEKHNPAN